MYKIITIIISFYSISVIADDAYELAKKIKFYDQGWKSMKAAMLMTITDNKDRQSFRELSIQALEIEGDGDKSLMIFDKPKDIQGTAFLTHSHVNQADDQWLFMPSIRRVKRITSENKSGPFMGSEFAYEDMTSFEVDRYKYKLLDDELIDNHKYKILISMPKDKNSGYSKTVSWVDSSRYTVYKTEFYDRQGVKIKILQHYRYQLYENKHWRPSYSVMKNIQNNRKSRIDWSNYAFRQNLNEGDFTVSRLRRFR